MKPTQRDRRAIVVAGVCGCGKSTLGQALANQLDWAFVEADEFHSEQSKAKMAAGIPLDDEDRIPWLNNLNLELHDNALSVLACSALKQSYRERLTRGVKARFVWLNLDKTVAIERVANRGNHFMSVDLVASQFETAEVPQDALILDATLAIEELTDRCISELCGSDLW